tara:strand:+ start:456 stop:671 length:216 start_codon:yes stop_codon:yes gene_type:complete
MQLLQEKWRITIISAKVNYSFFEDQHAYDSDNSAQPAEQDSVEWDMRLSCKRTSGPVAVHVPRGMLQAIAH